MRPFTIAIPDEQLADLRRRLVATRWPEPATEPGWAQGPPLEWMRGLVEYWIEQYDWRDRESRLNRHPQVLVEVGGLDIHAAHIRAGRAGAIPVILTHGWPGSFAEYLGVAEALAARGCDVVVPSLPGYAFSGKPAERGWGVERTADAWVELMAAFSYDRFIAVGSDWGTSVSAAIGTRHPDAVRALVLIPPLVAPDPATADDRTPAEQGAAIALAARETDGSAYSAVHETRPQTIGYALGDSPVALAAWIAEKFQAWSNVEISRDDLLDGVMLYWLTNSGGSSARLYLESIDDVSGYFTTAQPDPIDVPVGGVMFPAEVPWVSRRWAERRFPDIRVWVEPERGGHFGALENPDAVVESVLRTIEATR
jgi:epoxide hydrolase